MSSVYEEAGMGSDKVLLASSIRSLNRPLCTHESRLKSFRCTCPVRGSQGTHLDCGLPTVLCLPGLFGFKGQPVFSLTMPYLCFELGGPSWTMTFTGQVASYFISTMASSSNDTVSSGLAIQAQQHALRALKSLPPPLRNWSPTCSVLLG